MPTKHKHYDAIIAYANGEQIELEIATGQWRLCNNPTFLENLQYRVYDKFRELKEAHAAGKVIQVFVNRENCWLTTSYPSWHKDGKFRVRPDELYIAIAASNDGHIVQLVREDGSFYVYPAETLTVNTPMPDNVTVKILPKKTRHVHAELMMQYAEDAMETDKPWERWEYKKSNGQWYTYTSPHLLWHPDRQYRRKSNVN